MKSALFCLLTLFGTSAMAQPVLTIDREISASRHVLRGMVSNLDTPARYRLTLVKSGTGGTSNLSQSGALDASPEAQRTSSIGILIPDGARYRVTLSLFNGTTLLGETALTFPE